MTTTLCEAPPVAASSMKTSSRPLKVCHVSLTLKTGGLERILADLAHHHLPERCEPTFLALREIGRFGEEIRALGRHVAVLKDQSRFGGLREMARFFREHQFDIVHTHNTYPHIYGTIAARWAGVPVVVQTRHGQRAGHGWKSSLQYRWAARWTDRIITVSDDAAGLCVTADRIPAAKVTRIWNGIDLSQFRFTGPSTDLVAIAVARLSAEKDFPTLLRAMALVVPRVPTLRLKIVGDGPERAALESLADELHLRNNIEFLGERRDVPQLLTQAGFFVTSSLTEGISLTLLEAMAVGLPVVATSVGGNPEIVVDGETGRLAPAANPTALAAAIVAMCEDRAQWPAFGRAGCERAAAHFDIHRMARDYEDLYETIIETKRHRRG
jgi:glycosyltransferase involved in cell wall biosynthesis